MKTVKISLAVKIWILLVIFVVPLNLLALGNAFIMISDARRTITNSIQSVIDNQMVAMDERITNADYFLYSFTKYNVDYQSYFQSEDSFPYQLSKSTIINNVMTHQSGVRTADYYFLYQEKQKDFLMIPHNDKVFDKYLFQDGYFEDTENLKHKWSLIKVDKKYYLIREFYDYPTWYGAIIRLDNLLEDINQYLEYPLEDMQFISPGAEDKGKLWLSGTLRKADISVYFALNQNQINRRIDYWRWAMAVIVVMFLLLMPVLYLAIHRWLITPLKILSSAHGELEKGREEYRITVKAKSDEFASVYQSFNNMAQFLQELRLENINKELAKNRMLLDNLQLQIRPHFLLNNFNLLYTVIQKREIETAQKMILYLSNYFRYLFQYDHRLELFDKEFELIQRYLEIAEIKNPGAFTFRADFDPEISLVRVPPLLLHNFVENIISHALLPDRVVHIMFYASYEEGIATFQIADDGRGMQQKDVDRINREEYEEYARGLHVGIRNSITRIKYFYDQKACINVESTLGEGTVFTITIPYNLEESESMKNDIVDGK